MNKQIVNDKTEEISPKQKLFGLPRPAGGALVGVLIYSLLYLWFFNLLTNKKVYLLFLMLTLPGSVILQITDNQVLQEILFIGTPSIPFAYLGTLIISERTTKRVIGIIILIIYFLFLFMLGSIILIFGLDV